MTLLSVLLFLLTAQASSLLTCNFQHNTSKLQPEQTSNKREQHLPAVINVSSSTCARPVVTRSQNVCCGRELGKIREDMRLSVSSLCHLIFSEGTGRPNTGSFSCTSHVRQLPSERLWFEANHLKSSIQTSYFLLLHFDKTLVRFRHNTCFVRLR